MPQDPEVYKEVVTVGMGTTARRLGVWHFQTREGPKTWMGLDWPPHVKTCLVWAFTPERKVVLIENYRFPIGRRVLELPGGDPRSPEEKLEDVALRELREETGYDTKRSLVLFTQGWLQTGMSSAPFVVFLAEDCVKKGSQALDPIEEATGMTVVEMTPAELLSQIARDPLSVDTHGIDRVIAELVMKGIIP